jgi:hypothetical protein
MLSITVWVAQMARVVCDPALSGVEVSTAESDFSLHDVRDPNGPALQRLGNSQPSGFSPGEYLDVARPVMYWPGAPVLRVRITTLA